MIKLLAQLQLDSAGFTARIDAAKSKVAAMKKEFVASAKENPLAAQVAGMAAVGTAVAGIRSIVDYGGRITDLSNGFSITTDTVQALDYAAQQTGANLETALGSIKKIGLNAVGAIGGDTDKLAAFERLGITAAELKTLSPEQIFFQVAEALKDMPLTAQTFKDMQDTLGRSATDLLPMFREGLAGLMTEAKETGAVIDAETIAKLDEAGDAAAAMWFQFRAAAAPVLTFVAGKVQEMIRGFSMISSWMEDTLTQAFVLQDIQNEVIGGNFKNAAFLVDTAARANEDGLMETGEEDIGDLHAKAEAKKGSGARNNARRASLSGVGGFAEEDETPEGVAATVAKKRADEEQKLRERIEGKEVAEKPDRERLKILQEQLAEAMKDAEDTNNDGSLENLRAQARILDIKEKVAKIEKKEEAAAEKEEGEKDKIKDKMKSRKDAHLSEGARLKKLEADLAEAQQRMSDTNNDGSLENLRAQDDAAELKDEIAKIKKKQDVPERIEKDKLDSIQQIGGRIGENANIQNGQRQLKTLEQILQNVKEGNQNTSVLNPNR